MADIRINALANTASSTASDDYLAVDGTTNGTRKLNAYSPTFGGNLTVSGNVNLTSNASLIQFPSTTDLPKLYLFSNTYGLGIDNTDAVFFAGSGGGIRFKADSVSGTQWGRINGSGLSVAGNLTVSGTGTSSVAGNWLVGTTTDSGNGKLQLATHTTSAGGIGFGTADSLYTAGVGDLRFKTTSAEAAITLLSGGAYIGSVTAGKSTFIISGTGSTALTLDSSQNATFAGKITAGTWASGTAEKLQANTTANNYAGFFANTASSGNGYALRLHTNGTTSGDYPLFVSSGAGAGSLIFGVTGNGNATFAGAIAIGNTVAAAAGVASTHKVTISIGGSTYYLLATNV